MGRKERLQRKYQNQASESDIKTIDRIAKNWQHVEALWQLIKDPQAAWPQKAVAIGALIYLYSAAVMLNDRLETVVQNYSELLDHGVAEKTDRWIQEITKEATPSNPRAA